jgi:hypothetical protein
MAHTSRPVELSEKIDVFEDELGLPRNFNLITPQGQLVVQYRAVLSTNFMGWNIPLEFHLAEYQGRGTNTWSIALTAKGKVTSISAGPGPHLLSPSH